jgi:hypothetical protein
MLAEPEGRGSTDAALSEEHPIASAAAATKPHTDTGRAILIMFEGCHDHAAPLTQPHERWFGASALSKTLD